MMTPPTRIIVLTLFLASCAQPPRERAAAESVATRAETPGEPDSVIVIDGPTLAARGVRRTMHIGPVVRWSQAGRRDSLILSPDSGVAYMFWGPAGLSIRRGVMTVEGITGFLDSALAGRLRRPSS